MSRRTHSTRSWLPLALLALLAYASVPAFVGGQFSSILTSAKFSGETPVGVCEHVDHWAFSVEIYHHIQVEFPPGQASSGRKLPLCRPHGCVATCKWYVKNTDVEQDTNICRWQKLGNTPNLLMMNIYDGKLCWDCGTSCNEARPATKDLQQVLSHLVDLLLFLEGMLHGEAHNNLRGAAKAFCFSFQFLKAGCWFLAREWVP